MPVKTLTGTVAGAQFKILIISGYKFIIDEDDYDLIVKYKWRAIKVNKFTHPIIYATTKINNKTVYLHRFISATPPELVVDHINGDTLDNRKINLRNVHRSINQINKKTSGSSKYRGVSWNKNAQKWESRIRFQGQTHRAGYFESEIEAAIARDKLATSLFGTSVILNFNVNNNFFINDQHGGR